MTPLCFHSPSQSVPINSKGSVFLHWKLVYLKKTKRMHIGWGGCWDVFHLCISTAQGVPLASAAEVSWWPFRCTNCSYQRSKILGEAGRNSQLGLTHLQGEGIFHSVMSVCAAVVNDRKAWQGPVLGLPEAIMPSPKSVRTLVSKECAHHNTGLGEWECCKVKENGRARWKEDSKHLMNSLPAGELGTLRLSPLLFPVGGQ